MLALVGVCMLAATLAIGLEPRHSLSLSLQRLRYFHRYGQWSVQWNNISRVFQPSFSEGLERKHIPYIAIKLNNLENIAQQISPRLASRLIHEQRGLMILACQLGEISPEQLQLNMANYKMPAGYAITGPIAAWLHQADALAQAYGGHLFIPLNCTYQSADELTALIREGIKNGREI